jgi:hypothetical protein
MFPLRSGPPDSAVYVLQRRSSTDRRGRLYVDAQNGIGLKRIRLYSAKGGPEEIVFDWGRYSDPDRCAMTGFAILQHALDSAEWAEQLKWQFSLLVMRRMDDAGGRLIAGTIRKYVTIIELGLENVKK